MLSADDARQIKAILWRRLTLEQAEARYADLELDTLLLIGSSGGWVEYFRETIVAEMRPGDQLWLYDSDREHWANLCGVRGLALVRDGRVVETMLECRN
jgi:hypothetical protein